MSSAFVCIFCCLPCWKHLSAHRGNELPPGGSSSQIPPAHITKVRYSSHIINLLTTQNQKIYLERFVTELPQSGWCPPPRFAHSLHSTQTGQQTVQRFFKKRNRTQKKTLGGGIGEKKKEAVSCFPSCTHRALSKQSKSTSTLEDSTRWWFRCWCRNLVRPVILQSGNFLRQSLPPPRHPVPSGLQWRHL